MDQYTELEPMGSGATSDVYLVEDRRSKRQYIMKQMPTTGMSEQERQRARTEMHVLQRIDHPNIVKYRDSFVAQDSLCIVMERCATSLEKVIERKRDEVLSGASGPFSTNTLLEWMAELLSAVHYLHSRNIIHRDIKPSNIFVTSTNHLKLGDFGVCKVLTAATSNSTMIPGSMVAASHGAMIGTPLYFAPEIFEGDVPEYSAASDVWSLGLVFYEMCALRPALEATNFFALMHAIMNQEIPPFGNGVDPRFERITRRMLSRNPKDRPTTQQLIDRYVVVPASHPSHPSQRPERGRLIQERHGIPLDSEMSSGSTTNTNSNSAPASSSATTQPAADASEVVSDAPTRDVSAISDAPPATTSSPSSSTASSPSSSAQSHSSVTSSDCDVDVPPIATHSPPIAAGHGAVKQQQLQAPSAAHSSPQSIVSRKVGSQSHQGSQPRVKGAPSSTAASPPAKAQPKKPSTTAQPGSTSSPPATAPSAAKKFPAASSSSPHLGHSSSVRQSSNGSFLAPSDHEDALKRIREAKSKINVSELRDRMKAKKAELLHGTSGITVVSPVPSHAADRAAVSTCTAAATEGYTTPSRHRDPSHFETETLSALPGVAAASIDPVSALDNLLAACSATISLEDLDSMARSLHHFKLERFGCI